MAIDLLALEPQKISKNLRGKFLMFYSAPGAVKTTLAAQFDHVLIAAFEMGSNALNNVHVQPVKTWAEWKTMISQLTKKRELVDKYHTIAIDTVDEAWTLCTKYICNENNVERLGDLPYGQGYDLAKKEFAQTFRDLAYSGYGLIFISHSTEKTFKDDKGKEYTQIVPALANRPFDVINKMVDIIGYIREVTVGEGDNAVRRRYIFLRDTVGDRFLVKSRYRYIVPQIELTYQGLVDAIYDAIDKEIAHSGGEATDEANPFLVKNFDELMEDAKELWTKAMNMNKTQAVIEILTKEFGKPTKFSEILPSQIDNLVNVLQEARSILN